MKNIPTATFRANIEAFVKKANGNLDAVVKQVVFNVGQKLVMRSPVGDGKFWKSPPPPGYVGGRFRANWQYGYNTMPTGELPDIDASGQASINRIIAGASAAPGAGIHYIVNNLPYAKRLEEGWSHRQAPAGMVGLTAMEFQSMVKEATLK